MHGLRKVLVIVAGVGAVVAAVTAYTLMRADGLPETRRDVHRDVFPDLDYRAAAPGTSIDRIYGAFGKQLPDMATGGPARQCIYFMYDPDLFEGALVVLASSRVVEKRWVAKGATKPDECSGLPEARVDLRGWYAAGVR